MTQIADANGRVIGHFTIPAGVRPGTKLVKFKGEHGSVATALYTANGQVIDATMETIEIVPPPKPVLAVDTTYTVRKNQALTIAPASGVLAKSSTPNGGALVLSAYTQPASNGTASGTVVATDDGGFTFTPANNFVGLVSFVATMTDSSGESGVACAFIEVLELNQPPIANDDNWETLFNTQKSANVITNDSSPDGNPITLTGSTNPSHGIISTQPDGTITYTPATNFTGVDSFTYTITDTVNGLSDTATVWVHVNAPPIKAVNDEVNLNVLWGSSPGHARLSGYGSYNGNTNVPIDVMSNDTKNANCVIVSVTQPVGHDDIYTPTTSIIEAGKKVNYYVKTGPASSNGFRFTIDDTFQYTIRDTLTGAESTATVHIYANNIYVDPLAETFSLDVAKQLWGVDVWVETKGVSPLAIELREVVYGIPDQRPLGRGMIPLASVVEGAWNRIMFDVPFAAVPGKNYAFVAMCDDSVTELAMAEIGKFDLDAQEWVTSQPYSIGVMLTSSNNATWTPHQNSDITFRLLSKKYSTTTKRISLGSVSLVGDTDFLVAADVVVPAIGCGVEFELEMPSGAIYTVAAHQPLALSSGETGTMSVTAVLTGTEDFTPVLGKDVTVLHGPIQTTGTYRSRSMVAGGTDNRVRCIYEAKLPSGASVSATLHRFQAGVGELGTTSFPAATTTLLDDGYVEYSHELTAVSADSVSVTLTVNGSAAARPLVRNFRAMVM